MKVDNEDAQFMSEDNAGCLIQIMMIPTETKLTESYKESVENMKRGVFVNQIIAKRIEVLDLPITIDDQLWMAIPLFADRAGGAVILLIDCLEYLDTVDTQIMTLGDLCTYVYPAGFYKEEAFIKRIDEIKAGNFTSDWCKIY